MQLARYIRCTANGKWKFRKAVPRKWREALGRREIKLNLVSANIFDAVKEAMQICQNLQGLMQNIEMTNQKNKPLPSFGLVTVRNQNVVASGITTIEQLSFDANDPNDRAEVVRRLNLLAEVNVPQPQVQKSGSKVFRLSRALEINKTKRDLKPATLKKIKRVYQLAIDIIGDIDLNADDAKEKMTHFLKEAEKEPLRRSQIKVLEGKTYAQQRKYADKHDLPRVSQSTVINLANLLSSSLEVVMELDSGLTQVPLSYKQTTKVIGKQEEKNKNADDGVGFTEKEIQTIFSKANLETVKEPGLLVGYLIGLHTGMRVNEVASLQISHIVEKNGIACFDLTNWDIGISQANAGKACLKTVSSRRLIPISQGLLDAGLMRYVELVRDSGNSLLLPNMTWNETGGYGRKLSRGFMSYMNSLGIAQEKGFHELRKTINDGWKQMGISQEFREDFLGHSNKTMNSRHYSNPTTLKNLQNMVNQIAYPVIYIFDFFNEKEVLQWAIEQNKKRARPKLAKKPKVEKFLTM